MSSAADGTATLPACTRRGVDLDLPGGRVLRVALWISEDGTPEALVLGKRWRDEPDTAPGSSELALSGAVLGPLIEALSTLAKADRSR